MRCLLCMGNPDLSRAVVQGTARLQEAVARQEWRRGSTLLGGKSDNKHASPPGSGRFFCISEDQSLCELEIARVVSSNKFKIVKGLPQLPCFFWERRPWQRNKTRSRYQSVRCGREGKCVGELHELRITLCSDRPLRLIRFIHLAIQWGFGRRILAVTARTCRVLGSFAPWNILEPWGSVLALWTWAIVSCVDVW